MKKGVNANATEEVTGWSALTLAINKGSPPEVEALIAAGANVNEKDTKNRTRLEHAIDKYMVARFTRTTLADKHAAPYAKKIVGIIASTLSLNLGAKTSNGSDHASYARKAGLKEIADALAANTTKAQSGVAGRTDTVE